MLDGFVLTPPYMKKSARILGLYQIIGGVISFLALGRMPGERGAVATGILILLAGLAIAAGVGMWRGARYGRQLTILNQLAQILGVYTPVLAFNVVHGAGLTLGTTYVAASTFAASNIHTGMQITLGSSVCDVWWGRLLTGMPDYGLSVNLLALALLIYAVKMRKRSPAPV
jgi:hypothetical protein